MLDFKLVIKKFVMDKSGKRTSYIAKVCLGYAKNEVQLPEKYNTNFNPLLESSIA